jgi:signal transduction histidine kinase
MALEAFRPSLEEPAQAAMCEIARKSATRAGDLVRQILAFARGAEEARGPIEPRGVVQEIAAAVRATFPAALRIQTEVAENLAPIVGNATQLHRALLNLCVNARDAMPNGGTLTLRATNVVFDHANIRLPRNGRDGRYVLIEVSDTGSGIPASIREKIFDPFFTTKGAGKGTGLGLASVRSIVESHSGLLSVQSEIGAGTTFRILIPVCDVASVSPSPRELRIVAA